MTQHPNLSFLCGFLTDGTVLQTFFSVPSMVLSKERSTRLTQNPNTETNMDLARILISTMIGVN